MRCIGIVIDMGAKGLTFSFSQKNFVIKLSSFLNTKNPNAMH